MALSFLRTYNFRNLVNSEGFHFRGREIFLVGRNGQGKTNFLESIYYLSCGNSFRTKLKRDIVRRGEEESSLFGTFVDSNDELFRDDVKIVFGKNSTKAEKNGTKILNRAELFFNFPAVVFSHSDMNLIQGPMEIRRNFFDRTISLFNREYFDILKRYGKVLKNKNLLLKENGKDERLIKLYDEKMIQYGVKIVRERKKLIEEFNRIFEEMLNRISFDLSDLRIRYSPSWGEIIEIEKIMKIVNRNREREKYLGFTLSGPHRDRFLFEKEGKDFSSIASTGQVRLCSLALKIGQASFIYERRGKKPILLLDDVLLEMDGEKRVKFLKNIVNYEQSFFTFLPEEDFLSYRKESTEIFFVENGSLKRWKE